MLKYKKLKIDCQIPDFLEYDIDEYLAYLNSGKEPGLGDVYQSTIRSDINECEGYTLESVFAEMLREYYVRGGIFRGTN